MNVVHQLFQIDNELDELQEKKQRLLFESFIKAKDFQFCLIRSMKDFNKLKTLGNKNQLIIDFLLFPHGTCNEQAKICNVYDLQLTIGIKVPENNSCELKPSLNTKLIQLLHCPLEEIFILENFNELNLEQKNKLLWEIKEKDKQKIEKFGDDGYRNKIDFNGLTAYYKENIRECFFESFIEKSCFKLLDSSLNEICLDKVPDKELFIKEIINLLHNYKEDNFVSYAIKSHIQSFHHIVAENSTFYLNHNLTSSTICDKMNISHKAKI